MVKKLILSTAILAGGAFWASCGGGGAGSSPVALYFTDVPGDQFSSVEVTVYEVNLCKDPACTDKVNLFRDTSGVKVDLKKLSAVLQYVDTVNIPAGNYSRLEIVLGQNVTINGTQPAKFTHMDEKPTKPNEVNCPPGFTDANGNQLCYIRYNGVVNPTSSGQLVIDFSLKEFEVKTTTTPWSITEVKVTPLTPAQIKASSKSYEIYAVISSIGTNSITVDWRGTPYTVNIDPNITKCEINSIEYKPGSNPCSASLFSNSVNSCVEIKSIEDPSSNNTLTAKEIEVKSSDKCGSSGYSSEIKGIVQRKDSGNNTFTLNNYSKPIKVTNSTKCEYHDVYYYGLDCFKYLPLNWHVEVKLNSKDEAVKIETES